MEGIPIIMQPFGQTYLGLSLTPTFSSPMPCVQASLPIANITCGVKIQSVLSMWTVWIGYLFKPHISTYKISRLTPLHFLTESVEKIW